MEIAFNEKSAKLGRLPGTEWARRAGHTQRPSGVAETQDQPYGMVDVADNGADSRFAGVADP